MNLEPTISHHDATINYVNEIKEGDTALTEEENLERIMKILDQSFKGLQADQTKAKKVSLKPPDSTKNISKDNASTDTREQLDDISAELQELYRYFEGTDLATGHEDLNKVIESVSGGGEGPITTEQKESPKEESLKRPEKKKVTSSDTNVEYDSDSLAPLTELLTGDKKPKSILKKSSSLELAKEEEKLRLETLKQQSETLEQQSEILELQPEKKLHTVQTQDKVPGKLRQLMEKVSKFFSGIYEKIIASYDQWKMGRQQSKQEKVERAKALALSTVSNTSIQLEGRKAQLGQTSSSIFPFTPKKDQVEILNFGSSLFLDPGELRKDVGPKDEVAKAAVAQGLHKNVPEREIEGLGHLKAFSFDENGVVENQVIPTSFRGGVEQESVHLENAYVLSRDDGKPPIIRTARIDSKQRADDFIALIRHIHKPGEKLRIMSHQLNSSEKEKSMIADQHRLMMTYVNEQLNDIAEVIHIDLPSNRFYDITKKAEQTVLAPIAKKVLGGEAYAKNQNLDSWGTYVKWLYEDLTKDDLSKDFPSIAEQLASIESNVEILRKQKTQIDLKLKELDKLKKDLEGAESSKRKQELKEQIKVDKEAIGDQRKAMKVKLKSDHTSLTAIEKELSRLVNEEGKKELSEKLLSVSLMRQVLGSQLDIEGQKLDRGQEGMTLQMLDELLGVTPQWNCKSGLDRTGLWNAVDMARIQMENLLEEEPERLHALITEWEQTTSILNKLVSALGAEGRTFTEWIDGNSEKTLEDWEQKLGENFLSDLPLTDGEKKSKFNELKQKLRDVANLRNMVVDNLVKIGVEITAVSTGVVGLKWNEGFQENLIPLNFLPPYVVKDQETVPLVKYNNDGKVSGITDAGGGLLKHLSSKRKS